MSNLAKSGILTLIFIIGFVFAWEQYQRIKGFDTYYDDSEALWADKRAMVYEPSDQATVFIGSSRIKFDLDIPTWEKLTGDRAIQLAMVGSSPVPVLSDLAADENFKGKLIIDVTEPLFFSNAPPNMARPNQNISYYKNRTPTQRFGFIVNRFMESKFAFLDQEFLSLNSILQRMSIPKRDRVFVFPEFPTGFDRTDFNRQSIMSESFVKDESLHKKTQDIWLFFIEASKQFPPTSEEELEGIFKQVKSNVEQIEDRGGKVIFVRTPSSGPLWMGEQQGFPREKFWERLMGLTDSPAIHFADFPATAAYDCPEWSHLSPADAKKYTVQLVQQIESQGWEFPHKPGSKKPLSMLK